jgi:hypothetical protein
LKKTVVLVNHFNRVPLLDRTLSSIARSKHDNYQVIVLDHDSPCDLEPIRRKYRWAKFVSKEKPSKDNWYSCIVSHNQMMLEILDTMDPEVIVFQDAECYHVGDVLALTDNIGESDYYSFACFSADQETTMRSDFEDAIERIARGCHREVWGNGVSAWYNHPVYRGVGYGFCAAMLAKNMVKLNDLDERYMDGVAYGDDDYVRRIRIMGLKTTIPISSFVVHQWHYDASYVIDETLLRKNRDLYQKIATEECGYKAKHLITKDFDWRMQ